eukprot:4346528-Prymnesium_polylepis.1
MKKSSMLDKSVKVAAACREAGVKVGSVCLRNTGRFVPTPVNPRAMQVMHAAITFKEDGTDNPNGSLGILAGCKGDKL